jgi:hypothetical protein
MKARRLIESSAYGPVTLKVISQAFDEGWSEIAHHFHGDPSIEDARLRLAHAVLVVAREDINDAEKVKTDALQVMALAYRTRA